ncbi:transcriptional regulatory protein, lysr family [Roseobacter sp. SK209-2-6]|nr:transcriptional regulatory protein, lysr family [Roseobacter sp. SK209-2-6]
MHGKNDMRLSAQLKLRHLEVFVEVARQNSVTLAAEALGMTQPAATRALRELETVCGKPLVERDGRGIRLSAYGEMFRDHAGRSLALARDGVSLLQGLEAEEGTRLAIGALPTVAANLVPDAVAQINAEGSRSRIGVVSGDNRYLLDQLRRGHLDLVVGRLPAPEQMAGVEFQTLFHESVAVVVSNTHPLASEVELSPDTFENFPVLMPTEGSIIRPLVEGMFLEQGIIAPKFPLETVSSEFGRRFVYQHQAIWIISQGVVQEDLEQGRMVRLPIQTSGTSGPVGICLRREHQLSPAATRFSSVLRELSKNRFLV